ncbi:hypothetical protein ACIBQX_05790 [Nonomuraea sp. NPDC049714]|uniref:hypothetical protein n=1 Tax=Nonomuraea sp. NPDC049714 TaxID=3364357 RepID=UPI0037B46409
MRAEISGPSAGDATAVPLSTELGQMLPGELLGEVATRTAAQSQSAVPDEAVPPLKRTLDASAAGSA